MKIRAAIHADIPGIQELSRVFFLEQAHMQPQVIRGGEYDERYLLDIIQSDKSEILIAEENDGLAGFVILAEKEVPSAPHRIWRRFAHLMHLMVKPEFRGRGVGIRLIQEGKEWTRKRDLAYVELNLLAENDTAYRLYEKNGFHDVLRTMRCQVERLPLPEAVERVLFNNDAVLELYFSLLAGGELWDGLPHRLYFDAEKRLVIFRRGRAGENADTPTETDLRLLHQTCEVKEVPREDLFDPDNDCRSLKNYGYDEWREEMRQGILTILTEGA